MYSAINILWILVMYGDVGSLASRPQAALEKSPEGDETQTDVLRGRSYEHAILSVRLLKVPVVPVYSEMVRVLRYVPPCLFSWKARALRTRHAC